MSDRPAGSRRSQVIVTAVVAALLGVAFVGGAWWNHEQAQVAIDAARGDASPEAADTAETGDAEIAPDRTQADTIAPAVPVSVPATADWPPLPPLDAPVAEVFDDLVDRARRGDAKAACRLGAELQRCLMASANSNAAASIELDVSRRNTTPEGAADAIARLQSAAETRGRGCDGVAMEQMRTAFQWQKQAALANPDLRVAFALSPALDPRDFVNELDAWQEYRTLAMPWLEAAAAQGDVAAVIALARVHGDMRRTSPPMPRFRMQDDEAFVVYADLMQRYGSNVAIVQREADAARERLSPDARQRASDRADALYRADAVLDEAAAGEAMRMSLRGVPEPERCE